MSRRYARAMDGLPRDGSGAAAVPRRVDRLTMVLAMAVGIAVAVPSPAMAARYGSRTLRIGAHGGDVTQLQRLLTEAGHRTRRDGEFGPRTAVLIMASLGLFFTSVLAIWLRRRGP